jgi:glycosyltransferase involved in cell wall biosynthesis
MMPKVSIIIPVYNTEELLHKCLTSAITQTLKEIEIIIIDDKSTDKSLEIIKSFSRDDKRIRVIAFEKNKGNGFGRNEGLKNATGDYIIFLDSDDWLENSAAEVLYYKAQKEKVDVVLYGFIRHQPLFGRTNAMILEIPILEENDNDFYLYFLMHRKGLYSMPWIYIFSRKLLINNNVLFSEGIFFEDVIFVAKALNLVKKIGVYKDKPLYNYKLRHASITQSVSKKKIDDLYTAHFYLKEFLKDNQLLEKFKEEYTYRFLLDCVAPSFVDFSRLEKNKKDKDLKRFMKKIRKSEFLSLSNIQFLKKTIIRAGKEDGGLSHANDTKANFLFEIKYNLFKFRAILLKPYKKFEIFTNRFRKRILLKFDKSKTK